jgi:hypothetical protein
MPKILIDKISTEKSAAINELKGADVQPYLSKLTQGQLRDVMDTIKQYNDTSISNRTTQLARQAGELGLDASALGLGKGEVKGVEDAIEEGRQSTIARFTQRARATGGGDGGIFLDNPPPVLVTDPPHPPGSVPPVPPPVTAAQPATQTPFPWAGGGPNGSQAGAPPAQPTAPSPGGPVTIAGQAISAPPIEGASPNFLPATQRIESGNERTPWQAGNGTTSAKGAFQIIGQTWRDNRPPGAPNDPSSATPQQQTEAAANYANKNAAALKAANIPVNDTNLYIAHNLGTAGGPKLLRADPNADARSVVGEDAARNNPLFFRGRPTVATALARYQNEMAQGGATGGNIADVARHSANAMLRRGQAGPLPPSGPLSQPEVNPNAPPINQGYQQEEENKKRGEVSLGMAGGMAGSLVGGPVGGAAGGAGGQMLENYLRGDHVLQPNVVGSAAFGAAGGIEGAGLKGAALRAGTAAAGGGVEGGLENGVPGAIAGAVEGGAGAAVGEGVGRTGAGAANALGRVVI